MRNADTAGVGAITKALLRPRTYVGHALEAVNIMKAAATYPLGVFEAALTLGEKCGDAEHDRPVILLHGYGHNRSGWFVLDRRLRQAEFTNVTTLNYNPLRESVPELAQRLADRVALVRTLSGADKVHVVGHSLGGVILRWFVQELGGDELVHTAITIASPHQGTVAALAGAPFSSVGRELLPGSATMRQLRKGTRRTAVRWIAFYSNLDMLVSPATSAMLLEPELRAANVLVKDQGHMSIMVSPFVARSIVQQLEAAEDGAAQIGAIAARSTSAAGSLPAGGTRVAR